MTTPHSIAEFTDPEVSPENNRKGTVSYASRFEDHQHIPAIIMKGQWLEAAGFATGAKIDIKQKQVQALIGAIAGQKRKLA